MKNKEVVELVLGIVHQKVKNEAAGTLPDLCDLSYGDKTADRFIKELKEYYSYKELMEKLKCPVEK